MPGSIGRDRGSDPPTPGISQVAIELSIEILVRTPSRSIGPLESKRSILSSVTYVDD